MARRHGARVIDEGRPTATGRRLAPALLVVGALLTVALARANGPGLPAPLGAYEAEYRIARGPLTLGTSTTTLAAVAEGWEYRTVARAQGLARMLVDGAATERSVLQATADGLRLQLYHSSKHDGEEARVRMDWAVNQALVHNADGSSVVDDVAAGTSDPHAAILNVMIALARDGDGIPSFDMIDDDGDITRLHFERQGEERIEVPFGTFDTIKVERVREDKDRRLIAWFAPALDWLPVRVRQIRDGSTVARMELRRLNGDAGEAADNAPPGRRAGP